MANQQGKSPYDSNQNPVKTAENRKSSDITSFLFTVVAAVLVISGLMLGYWHILILGMVSAIGAIVNLAMPGLGQTNAENKINQNYDAAAQTYIDAAEAYKIAKEEWEKGCGELVRTVNEEIPKLKNDRLAAEEALRQSREEAVGLRKERNDWHKAAIEYIDFIDRTLSFDGLNPDYRFAIEKSRVEFIRKVMPLGLIEINPKPGDEFDDRIHMAEGEKEGEGLAPFVVSEVEQCGFSFGSSVIRKSRVWVTPGKNR